MNVKELKKKSLLMACLHGLSLLVSSKLFTVQMVEREIGLVKFWFGGHMTHFPHLDSSLTSFPSSSQASS